MHDVTVQCPYCCELVVIELEVDTSGRFIQDCDVCCRPWAVRVERDADGQPAVHLERS